MKKTDLDDTNIWPNLADFGELIRRNELPFRPYLQAHLQDDVHKPVIKTATQALP